MTKVFFVPDKDLTDENSIRVRKDFILDRNLTCVAKLLIMYMQVKGADGMFEFDEKQATLDLFSGNVGAEELMEKGWNDGR